MSIDTSPTELEDPLSLAKVAETHSNWVREVAPQYGIDIPRYMLGDVLSTIVGDDANFLGEEGSPFSPDSVQLGKESLLIRLRWEINTKETPESIRERLQKFLPVAEKMDWENAKNFTEIKETWHKDIRDFVKHQIELNDSFGDAMNYEFEMDKILHPEYKEILFGKKE